VDTISLADARRLALNAQGLTDPVPKGRVDRRHVRRVLDRVGLIQIDSVNVLVRSHYLPLFSRLGPYSPALLDRLAYQDKELFEFWGHQASLIPVELHPLLRWKMLRNQAGETSVSHTSLGRKRPGYIEAVYEEVAAHGPIAASELEDPGTRRGPWWGWADGKHALELLLWAGRVSALRKPNFERVYDITERVIPAEILARPTPPEQEARAELLLMAARSLGVATFPDLTDYWSMRNPASRAAFKALVEDGRLVPVKVDGIQATSYVAADADAERRRPTRAVLLSPFDSVMWRRDRVEQLFGFRYRIEIFVPAPKRTYGYYVLPFLLGDRFAARVDLKSERALSTLAVQASYWEPTEEVTEVADTLAVELLSLARFLGLDKVRVDRRGDLARPLAAAVTREMRR
jgi:uncharacterized protein YcaQ